ncbi:MAG: ASKHA domain-containing protein, partial [Oscillospiraceae bacterium]
FENETGTDKRVYLTQRDIREVQLAKAAIAAGIKLLADELGTELEDIESVLIAGAFGNYMNPHSACAIGLIPRELEQKIHPIGNAAGEGAKLAAISAEEFEHAKRLAKTTGFLELASKPQFQDCFVDELEFFSEE